MVVVCVCTRKFTEIPPWCHISAIKGSLKINLYPT